jgi:hypothetical protein
LNSLFKVRVEKRVISLAIDKLASLQTKLHDVNVIYCNTVSVEDAQRELDWYAEITKQYYETLEAASLINEPDKTKNDKLLASLPRDTSDDRVQRLYHDTTDNTNPKAQSQSCLNPSNTFKKMLSRATGA